VDARWSWSPIGFSIRVFNSGAEVFEKRKDINGKLQLTMQI